ncbi:MAG TPA: FtsX-like permease family protein [Candidatus Sulfotelmatobacter sp.]|nr:FtsX-like permease family protein [Candidatus Sulfotelmatobacter sp.]
MTIGEALRVDMREWRLAARLARRELRGGIRGFRIFLACLTLGVAAIAAVGSISAAVVTGLQRDARVILGGDVTLRLLHRPASPDQLAWLERHAVAVSQSVEMRAMARPLDGARPQLIELKAVDDVYPLYGALETDPALPRAALFGRRDGVPGAAIERSLAVRLDLKPGDRIRIGDGTFEVRAVIAREPDRGVSAIDFGPRVMIAADALADTALIQPGSLVAYHYRLRSAQGVSSDRVVAALRRELPDVGWQVRDFHHATPGIDRFVRRITLFLTLVGLTALLVGGVGVGNAVRSYLDSKTATIATLKCVGARGTLVFRSYLLLVTVLAGIGVALGLAAGAGAPWLAGRAMGALLTVPLAVGVYPWPLLSAGLFGLLTAIAFSLWPLARAREVQAASLFRDVVAPTRRRPRAVYLVALALAIALLAALAVATAPDRGLAAWFVVGAAASFLVFRLLALGLIGLARAVGRPRHPRLRLALANLQRPGAPTASVVLSLGLGLTVLVIVALIEGNLSREIAERLPERAPSFFFIDIQPDQLAGFDALVAHFPGVASVQQVPMLRGRITRLNGVPVERSKVASDARWALDSDRGLTYAADPPAGTDIVAGSWWPPDYKGPPLVSFDAGLAGGMGLKVGDVLTVNVLGREVDARIANLRAIDWSSLGINFTMVFAPGLLEAAPHTQLAAVYADAAAEEPLVRAVSDRFTNVSAIRVKDALAAINEILGAIGVAARITASITLLAGTLVLAGAMVAGHHRRVYDAVVLKVLGATRRDLIGAFLLEYGLLGLATALIAGAAGTLGAWLVVTRVMHAEWTFLPATVAVVATLCAALTICVGLAGTWRALGQKAAPLLRNA